MFPMADKGSFLLPGSLDPPILPTPVPNATSSKGRPSWVLLDTVAYIADRKNETFAETTTRTNQAVGVSFWLADPPAVSHLCIHCPGMKVTDFLDEPLVVCSGKDIAVIRTAYAHGARPIESFVDMGAIDIDYLVYRVHDGKPSLQVIPNPKPLSFEPNEIGFLSSDGGDFFLSVVRPRRVPLQYDLHIFSSKTNMWTTRLALLEPPSPRHKTEHLLHQTDMVIAIEGGLLGWVDLWRGIILCDVLDSAPVLRYIQFPRPMDGNIIGYHPARAVRDVSCSNGFIQLIEIAESKGVAAAGGVESLPQDGWTAVSWKTNAHSKNWTKDCEAFVEGNSILHVLRQKHPEIPALDAPEVVGPVCSMHDKDVFYLMTKVDLKDKNGIAFTVNMMKNTVEDVISFPAERYFFFKLAYHPFAISKYLSMTLDGCKAATDYQTQELANSSIDPNNTTICVEGLDPCVTENQLKNILAMFGDVCYLKLHVNERYCIVRFANRSCAEEAMRTLNGAQIGSCGVRLSWRLSSSVNRQTPRRRFSECSGASYHPYARHYGVNRNTAAQANKEYTALVAAATHRSTTPLLQHQVLQPPISGNYSSTQTPRRRFSECSGASYHRYACHYGVNGNTAAQANKQYTALVAAATHRSTCGSTPLLQHQVLQPPIAGNSTNQD